ncbi:MAG TPA: hypothetical protein VFC78_05255 [Tepidisphaeraceae bacterium]|nr:hypothetical protein [Tepidisphaeraceae bacterium]
MNVFSHWLLHRSGLLGIPWPAGVADAAGLPVAALQAMADAGSLAHTSRSARGYLARAMKVSVRELEALADGRTQWIADERILDIDRLSPTCLRPDLGAALVPTPCAIHRGMPILGRVAPTGIVEHFDAWTPEDGPRLPVRYPGLPDAFAVELAGDVPPYSAGMCLAFQLVPPGELADQELALLTRSDAGETQLCRVCREEPMQLRLQGCGASQRDLIVAMADIVRAARILGAHLRPATRVQVNSENA